MYEVCAHISDVEYRPVLLDEGFQLNADRLLAACDDRTKVIWLCSPNNPTGNCLQRNEVERVIREFEGIVVVDEAYSDFNSQRPFRLDLAERPNLVVLNTMSKAWGCAAIRLGMAFASPEIIALFNKVKYPYNINLLTQEQADKILDRRFEVEDWVRLLLQERAKVMKAFAELPICKKVYPSDANFFLALVSDAQAVYDYLVEKGIIVRNRTRVELCNNCLRITIGTKSENIELLSALRQFK
jgi:histidinol-phosphate aminotransferase